MSREEKLQLNRERQKAVRDAWIRERELVRNGRGTVDWTIEQQQELIETGRVKGYEGQHMKSVNDYPEYAGIADNIQFLTHEEHLEAHNSGEEKAGYHSATNGYYDVSTKTMHSFGENPPHAPQSIKLSNSYYKESLQNNLNDRYLLLESENNRERISSLNNNRYIYGKR